MEPTTGEKLRIARMRKNLSQRDVGEAAGISANTIGKIERGDTSPTEEQMLALSRAIGVELTIGVS